MNIRIPLVRIVHRYVRLALMGVCLSAWSFACLTTASAPANPQSANPAPASSAVNSAPTSQSPEQPSEKIASAAAADPNGVNDKLPLTVDVAGDGNATLQLSPFSLALPTADAKASQAVRAFNDAAVRAVQRVYHEDADDPSVLLALQDQLNQRSELRPMLAAWQAPLTTAMARATTLQVLAPSLRALRLAMANAYFDERLKIYRDVDAQACARAFALLPGQEDSIANFVVTIEPIGTYPLSKFRTFCRDSRSELLKERKLPGKPAPESVSRLVRRLYNHAHLGGQVRKVALLSPWQRDKNAKQLTLRAVVGVVQTDSPNTDSCTMAEIAIIRPMYTSEPPMISEVGEREAILCTQLR